MDQRLKDSPFARAQRQAPLNETGHLMVEGWRAVKTGKPSIAGMGLEMGIDLSARALVAALLEDPEWGDQIREPTVRHKWTAGIVAAFIQECSMDAAELLYDLSRKRKQPTKAFASMLSECYQGVEHKKMSDLERAARSGSREWYEDLKREKERRDW